MANYTIIGGDGKQYGPITEADVRKWFEEGRLSGETQMKGESDAEFRSLSAFPEFGDLFQAAAPSVAVEDTAVRDDAAKRLKAPAI
ncbi:MAG TPA: GYF domain-containing protein, partial [Verrucomicrobiae bacterium]|nr:GYF domain-containing protein [Verrucomicrobiae bacterium]